MLDYYLRAGLFCILGWGKSLVVSVKVLMSLSTFSFLSQQGFEFLFLSFLLVRVMQHQGLCVFFTRL